MFECLLLQGDLFLKIVTAISDLVNDGNFQIGDNQIDFQGMDSSHVALVSLKLLKGGFENYRCDRSFSMGIHFESLNKVLKCMGSKDKLGLSCQENGEVLELSFESPDSNRISNFNLKLMEIDQDQLGIPETNYPVSIKMSSSSFAKIVRDMMSIGESVTVDVKKDQVEFVVNGDLGNGSIVLKQNISKTKKKKKQKEKKEIKTTTETIKKEEDEVMKEKETTKTKGEPSKEKIEVEEESESDFEISNADEVVINMEEPVKQSFALRYLNNFTKASNLSKFVHISMGNETPLKCSFKIGEFGLISYYLAPKIDD